MPKSQCDVIPLMLNKLREAPNSSLKTRKEKKEKSCFLLVMSNITESACYRMRSAGNAFHVFALNCLQRIC